MQRITFEIEKADDLQLLQLLAKRIGLKVVSPAVRVMDEQERQRHLGILAQGGDTSYIEDPMEWQREQRIDRVLPLETDSHASVK